MQAFADLVRMGKVLYVGVSEWTAEQLRDGARAGQGPRLPADLQPAAVLDAVAGDRGRGRAGLAGAGHLAGRLVADRPGRADREVPARRAAARGLAGHRRQGRREHDQALDARRRAEPGAAAQPLAEEAGLSMAALAVAWVLQNDNVATAIIGASRPEQVHDNVKAAGVKLDAGAAGQDRRDPRPGRSSATRPRRRRARRRPARPEPCGVVSHRNPGETAPLRLADGVVWHRHVEDDPPRVVNPAAHRPGGSRRRDPPGPLGPGPGPGRGRRRRGRRSGGRRRSRPVAGRRRSRRADVVAVAAGELVVARRRRRSRRRRCRRRSTSSPPRPMITSAPLVPAQDVAPVVPTIVGTQARRSAPRGRCRARAGRGRWSGRGSARRAPGRRCTGRRTTRPR